MLLSLLLACTPPKADVAPLDTALFDDTGTATATRTATATDTGSATATATDTATVTATETATATDTAAPLRPSTEWVFTELRFATAAEASAARRTSRLSALGPEALNPALDARVRTGSAVAALQVWDLAAEDLATGTSAWVGLFDGTDAGTREDDLDPATCAFDVQASEVEEGTRSRRAVLVSLASGTYRYRATTLSTLRVADGIALPVRGGVTFEAVVAADASTNTGFLTTSVRPGDLRDWIDALPETERTEAVTTLRAVLDAPGATTPDIDTDNDQVRDAYSVMLTYRATRCALHVP
jgi:hypothetical protein